MNNTLLPQPGGDLLVILSPLFLVVRRLLGKEPNRVLSVTLDGQVLHDWTLDHLASAVGGLRPERVLLSMRNEPDVESQSALRDALRRATLQAGISVVEIPDPAIMIARLAAPVDAKSRGRPTTIRLRLQGFMRRLDGRV